MNISLDERRRVLIAAQSNSNNILFDWDYTEGLNQKFTIVGNTEPIMQSDGLLLQSETAKFTTSSIVPNIPSMIRSYRATITYSDANIPEEYGGLFFCHFSDEKPQVYFGYYQRNGGQGYFRNANGTSITNAFVPALSGQIVIEYNSTTNTITFIQEQNKYETVLSEAAQSYMFARLLFVQTGNGTTPSSVKIQHLRIEKI